MPSPAYPDWAWTWLEQVCILCNQSCWTYDKIFEQSFPYFSLWLCQRWSYLASFSAYSVTICLHLNAFINTFCFCEEVLIEVYHFTMKICSIICSYLSSISIALYKQVLNQHIFSTYSVIYISTLMPSLPHYALVKVSIQYCLRGVNRCIISRVRLSCLHCHKSI